MGIIALVGLAAQTGVVMIVYIDHAFERRKAPARSAPRRHHRRAHGGDGPARAPQADDRGDDAHRPRAAAVGDGLGRRRDEADRAPMVGGLVTSAFLTLEIIPVVVTYWRREQLLWQRLDVLRPGPATPARGSTRSLVALGASARPPRWPSQASTSPSPAHAAARREVAGWSSWPASPSFLVLRRPPARQLVSAAGQLPATRASPERFATRGPQATSRTARTPARTPPAGLAPSGRGVEAAA